MSHPNLACLNKNKLYGTHQNDFPSLGMNSLIFSKFRKFGYNLSYNKTKEFIYLVAYAQYKPARS